MGVGDKGAACGAGGAGTEGFFAEAGAALDVVVFGAALAVVDGRTDVDGRAVVVLLRADEASDVRGAVRVVDGSTEGRVVRGRLAVVVVDAAALPGDARVDDELVDDDSGFFLTVGFFVSSPEVIDAARSGSASEVVVDLEASAVLLAVVPATGRVGGLLKLEDGLPERIVEVESGFDAPVVVLADAEVDDEAPAAGRRAPTVAVPPRVVVGLRGGMASLEEDEEAILRRIAEGEEEEGIVDVVVFAEPAAPGVGGGS